MKLRRGRNQAMGGETMRMIVAIIAAVIAATPAIAQQTVVTAESSLMDGARIAHDVRKAQNYYCPKPRSNTTAECNSDFEQVYPAFAEAIAWQILQVVAEGRRDTAKAAIYKQERDRRMAIAVGLQQKVERLYYALPAVSQTPPATTGRAPVSTQPKLVPARQ